MDGISVVIPAYGHSQFIRESVLSALAIGSLCSEVIVVSDGSPDDSIEVVGTINDPRIQVFTKENGGVASARNYGLERVKTEYVLFLDDDDVLIDENVPDLLSILRGSSLDFALGQAVQLGPHPDHPFPAALPASEANPFQVSCYASSPGQCLFRTKAVRDVGGFGEGLWGVDDWDLYIRLASLKAVLFYDKPVLRYRVHEANSSCRVLEHAGGVLRLYDKYWKEGIWLGSDVALHFENRLVGLLARRTLERDFTAHVQCLRLLWQLRQYSRSSFVRGLCVSYVRWLRYQKYMERA